MKHAWIYLAAVFALTWAAGMLWYDGYKRGLDDGARQTVESYERGRATGK